MTYSPKMRPCSKSVKEFTKTIKESEEDKQILNEKEISLLIKAKCKDIGIDFRETMFIKFKDFCKSKCKNRIADFSECYFGINSIKVINNLLLDKNRISRLDLTRNNLGDYGVELLVNSLINSISLVSLNITSNSISHRGGNIIFKSFIHQQSIIDLNISSIEGINRNRITSLGLKHIVVYLKKNIFIEILNLSGNSIKSEGFSLLCKGLKYNISLQNLDISNNDIHEKGIKKGIQFLNDSKIYTKLQILNLSNNPILNGGIIEITNNLRYFPNLKSINIAFCGIEFKGFNYLLRTVQYIKRIEYLNVSGNKLKDKEFSSIKPYFSSFNIRYLNMAKCSLCDINAYALGECLAANETLKTVNISDNEITDKGFKSFINLFKANISIENFDCSNNFITDISGKEFVNILKNNISLKYINLYDNQLHDETGNLIIEILEVNKCLVHINLNFNRIQVRIIEEINKTLNQNYDKQKINFIPGLLRNIKDLEFQPELFTILSKKILEKKSLQNFLYKKVRKDEKTFNLLINIEKRKIEKEKVKLNELLIEKKNIEMEIINILKKIEYYERERRKKEEEIKEKIEIEKNSLNEIYGENRKVMAEYNFVKDDLTNDFEKVQRNSIISREKFNSAKRYYEKKDRIY
jgi:Ran GTPase-activating protein (RanGAP) involved in mRNA processing and transport